MISRNLPIVGDEFVLGYRSQSEWQALIATAFFLGKIGAGLFLVSMLIQFAAGTLVGLLIAVVGKGIAHLLYLGRPARFWRALANPGSSWISRGLIGMLVFAVFGFIHLMPLYGWLELGTGTGLWWAIAIIAGLAALVVMVYDGFVLAASPAIPLWNTSLLPILCFFYALLGGTTLTIFLLYLLGQGFPVAAQLKNLEIWLLAINFIIVVTFLLTMNKSTAASREAIKQLLTGKLARLFMGAVIGVGLILTFLLAVYFTTNESIAVLAWIAIADLIGHYSIFYLLLKAGLYTPVSSR